MIKLADFISWICSQKMHFYTITKGIFKIRKIHLITCCQFPVTLLEMNKCWILLYFIFFSILLDLSAKIKMLKIRNFSNLIVILVVVYIKNNCKYEGLWILSWCIFHIEKNNVKFSNYSDDFEEKITRNEWTREVSTYINILHSEVFWLMGF